MILSITDRLDRRTPVLVEGVDDAGESAPIDGLALESSDPSIIAAEKGDDGRVFLRRVGAIRVPVQVRVTADDTPGEGGTPLSFTFDAQAESGPATGLRVALGQPEEIPAPPPPPEV